ncbi:hypothetical protein BC629DRAFT_1598880 [Irpex lacteus]|nr:hypothetical protein BC629DRAFT_1598880 [Irpex lacteus]
MFSQLTAFCAIVAATNVGVLGSPVSGTTVAAGSGSVHFTSSVTVPLTYVSSSDVTITASSVASSTPGNDSSVYPVFPTTVASGAHSSNGTIIPSIIGYSNAIPTTGGVASSTPAACAASSVASSVPVINSSVYSVFSNGTSILPIIGYSNAIPSTGGVASSTPVACGCPTQVTSSFHHHATGHPESTASRVSGNFSSINIGPSIVYSVFPSSAPTTIASVCECAPYSVSAVQTSGVGSCGSPVTVTSPYTVTVTVTASRHASGTAGSVTGTVVSATSGAATGTGVASGTVYSSVIVTGTFESSPTGTFAASGSTPGPSEAI